MRQNIDHPDANDWPEYLPAPANNHDEKQREGQVNQKAFRGNEAHHRYIKRARQTRADRNDGKRQRAHIARPDAKRARSFPAFCGNAHAPSKTHITQAIVQADCAKGQQCQQHVEIGEGADDRLGQAGHKIADAVDAIGELVELNQQLRENNCRTQSDKAQMKALHPQGWQSKQQSAQSSAQHGKANANAKGEPVNPAA